MNDETLKMISNDLNISRFSKSLTPVQYRCATIYSAAALWTKTATQDGLGHIETGSRRHVLKVCSTFLNSALDNESEEVLSYFKDKEDNESPAIIITDALIRVKEITEIGLDPNKLILSLPDKQIYQITNELQVVLGSLGAEKSYEFASGFALVFNDCDGEVPILKDNINIVENRLKELSLIEPTRKKPSEGDCYFDINEYGDRKFSRYAPHDNYPFEIVMNKTLAGEKHYIKTDRGFFEFSKFESELREPYRFMIYLIHHFNKKTFRITERGNVFFLEGDHALPLYEDSLIRLMLWPMRDLKDSACFFGPLEIKPYICQILNSLGLVI